MKALVSAILLIGFLSGGLRTISLINEYTEEAAEAYQRADYMEAVAAYEYLLNDLEVRDDQIRLNLAHAYFRIGDMQKAKQQYTLLAAEHTSRNSRAIALLQLGTIAAKELKYKQALSYFRRALITEPGNEAARYNYELIKKLLAQRPDLANANEEDEVLHDPESEQTPTPEQTQTPQQDDLTPQPKKKPDSAGDQEAEVETEEQEEDGAQEEQGSGNGQEQPKNGTDAKPENQDRQEASGQSPGETKGMNPDNVFDPNRPERSRGGEPLSEAEQRAQTRNSRLQQLNINPEKARLMLEAMRSAEQQYIQQLPKKATRTPDPSKPDW